MGFYPAPPSRRMPWDRDGSALVHVTNAAVITTRSAAERQAVNDESNTNLAMTINASAKTGIVFAIPQTVLGFYVAQAGSISGLNWICEYSLDTTTLNDGTWSTLRAAGAFGQEIDVPSTYRIYAVGTGSGIFTASPMPLTGVKGIRMRTISVTGSPSVGALHVYGYPTSPSNRLMLWHPTLDQGLAATPAIYDLGDIPRGAGPQVFSFRVKNISSTLTAQSVTLIREALTDGSPTTVSLTTLRYNGGAYGTTASVGNIAPGAISAVCDASIDITSLAPIGPWAPRIIAAATSWV